MKENNLTDHSDQRAMQQDDDEQLKCSCSSHQQPHCVHFRMGKCKDKPIPEGVKCKHYPNADDTCLVCSEEQATKQGLSLAITRCMNYLPKHLYEDLLKQAGFPEGAYEYKAPIRGLRIFVEHVYPPIPRSSFDWSAHYDDEEGPTGTGSTPYMAILDLINNANPTERQKG